MPVGTQATVKAVSPDELRTMGAKIILGNTYHLHVRPGEKVIEELGGLHRFMGWDRAILTDSGGFQVFSLSKLRRITEEGVHFQNHLDGTPTFIGPETSMQIQRDLGSDVVMAFDECPPFPCSYEEAARSLDLTTRWERRSREWWRNTQPEEGRPLLFGIVQGSSHADLRERSARELVEIGFDGYAVGGVSVGEPTRDPLPIEEGCLCPACTTFSRAYLRHLVKAEEILGLRLITLHNLHFYLGLMGKIRASILEGSFAEFRREFVSGYRVHHAVE